MKTLILFAHPALEKSRINKNLIKRIASIPNLRFHDLYQAHPDFDIAAGASEAKILIVAVDNPAKGIEIVETAQKHLINLPKPVKKIKII
jgi:putative NADPH-quinone reductase